MEFIYRINGMHCSACIEKIKTALSPHYEIASITLNPPLLKILSHAEPALSEMNQYISKAGKYSLQPVSEGSPEKLDAITGWRLYYPIFLIAGYITGVALINNITWPTIEWNGFMHQFMAGFFLVFSAFKLLDIQGFAEGYATYDLLAKRWHNYGYIYPFLELSLAILYLTQWFPSETLIATILLMGFSTIGVINSLLKKQKIQCACLGTFIKVPLSSITLIEDLTMVIMAILALIMK